MRLFSCFFINESSPVKNDLHTMNGFIDSTVVEKIGGAINYNTGLRLFIEGIECREILCSMMYGVKSRLDSRPDTMCHWGIRLTNEDKDFFHDKPNLLSLLSTLLDDEIETSSYVFKKNIVRHCCGPISRISNTNPAYVSYSTMLVRGLYEILQYVDPHINLKDLMLLILSEYKHFSYNYSDVVLGLVPLYYRYKGIAFPYKRPPSGLYHYSGIASFCIRSLRYDKDVELKENIISMCKLLGINTGRVYIGSGLSIDNL